MSLVLIAATGLGLLVLRVAGVDRHRAGIIVSLALLLFFSYGHVYYVLSEALPEFELRHRHLLVIWLILSLLAFYYVRRAGRQPSTHTYFLNIVGAFLLTLSLIQIVSHELSYRNVWRPGAESESDVPGVYSAEDMPDIYYIILDTYPSASTLSDYYQYDNGEFIEFLESRGFFVAEESFSNYAKTALSLASSLNMDYLDALGPNPAERIADEDYEIPRQMIENNNVFWFLKSRGYEIVFLGSGYGVTQANRFADREVGCGYLNETTGRIIETTLLWPFADALQVMANENRNKRLCAFAELGELAHADGPQFIFAHILSPHAPFLFDADGNPVREGISGPEQAVAQYRDQLIFVNKKAEIMVDAILAGSEVEPIIILQGDTGPPYGFESGKSSRFSTDEIYQQSMRILNAYHLPGDGAQSVYEGISPVNTFRAIFSYYFDAGFPLLDDRSFFVTFDRPFRLIDVTESVDYK
jgi:hypothetical protein